MPKHKTKGPLTLQGAAQTKQALRSPQDVCLSLKVLPLRDSAAAGRGLSALVHPSSMQQLLEQHHQQGSGAAEVSPAARCFLQLASGSDCVLHTRSRADIPAGCIEVDEVQQANLRLCPGEAYSFSVFVPGFKPDADSDDEGESEDEGTSTPNDDVDMHDGTMAAAAAVASAGSSGSEADGERHCSTSQQQQQQFELTDIDVEVRLLPGAATTTAAAAANTTSTSSSSSSSSSEPVQVDARVLTQVFCSQCFGRVVAANEYVVVDVPGCPPLLLRVVATNTLSADEQEDVLGYHCFRGLFTPDTQVYFTTTAIAASAQHSTTGHEQQQQQQPAQPPSVGAAADTTAQQLSQLTLQQQQQQQQQQNGAAHSVEHTNGTTNPPAPVQSRLGLTAVGGVAGGSSSSSSASIELLHARPRPAAAAPTNIVHVLTSDEEYFPVKKKLLRPCIALTKVVRDSGDSAPSVTVDIDTLTFDRVLIFLEAHALGKRPPRFAVHLLGDLQEAATKLGLRPLEQYCRKLLGRKQAAVQMYSFADVQRANASGKVWLILDGMVLDVGRWLPEHPGGATIIPKQSLNCDCARFFEMYHASKESFLYVQEFYIGELLPSDRIDVPLGGKEPPSCEFLQQELRGSTTWRQKMLHAAMARGQEPVAFKSF